MAQPFRHPIARGAAAFVVGVAGIAIACGRAATEPGLQNEESKVADVAAQVAQVAATVTGQPSPCHKDDSWSGQRQKLVDMGWGLAVVYVGQQTWGRTPHTPTPQQIARMMSSGKTCNADLISGERGRIDADDAIAATLKEGFPERSIVFLDIERMETMPQAMRDYYRAWAKRLLEDGRYRPGAYVHKHNAETVHDDLKAEFAAAGVNEEPRLWVASGRGFEEGKAPQDVGFAFAGVWQGMIDVARTVADIKLPLDINVSNWESPSAPERVGE
jgi:hypothetical protein